MIIIKGSDMELIAKMIINLEKNKIIYNTEGKLVNEEKAVHCLENNGITYKFHCNIFKLYCNQELWNNFEHKIEQILHDCDGHSDNGSYYDSGEMELLKTNHDWIDRQFTTRINSIRPTSSFKRYWILSDINTLMNDYKGVNKTKYVSHQLLKFNSIVIDTRDLFNFSSRITILNRPIANADFTFNKYIASDDIIIIKNLYAFIFKLCCPGLYVDFVKHMAAFYTINPVNEEKINNLNILRCNKSKISHKKIISVIEKQRKKSTTIIFDELEEARNIACGFPQTFNDICYKCKIPLYEDIYALKIPRKIEHSHMLLCRFCITYLIGTINKYNLELFRVNYPRKMDEVIRMLPIEEKEQRLLIDLYLNPCKKIAGRFENNNYKGYKHSKSLLLKIKEHDPNKQAFFYTNNDETLMKI